MNSVLKLLILTLITFTMEGQNIPKKVKIEKLPETFEEFLDLRNEIARTPEGGAVMLILATDAYASGKDWGEKALVVAVDRYYLKEGDTYKGYSLNRHSLDMMLRMLKKYPYVARSYIAGTSPEQQYKLPSPPYIFNFFRTKYTIARSQGDKVKIMIKCTGARPRPVTVKKNNRGIYKGFEFSSLYVGVRYEAPVQDDDL